MASVAGEKEFAVILFDIDDTYSTCSRKNKAAGSAGFFVGQEVSIQWSRHEIYNGVVAFADGEKCIGIHVLITSYYITLHDIMSCHVMY